MNRGRLDEILVVRGFFANRTRAKAAIEAGYVSCEGKVVTKPGREFPVDVPLNVSVKERYVSRAGEKLAAFLSSCSLSLKNSHVLDIGASTGGFTDCALQQGAVSVTCIDVGQGQLHPQIAADPRVTNREKVNARFLKAADLPRADYDAIVIDVSFISLKLILPAVWPFLRDGGMLVALVKPQFEVGKAIIDAGKGIVKESEQRQMALDDVREFATTTLDRVDVIGDITSPLAGTDGNIEFLLGLIKTEGKQGK